MLPLLFAIQVTFTGLPSLAPAVVNDGEVVQVHVVLVNEKGKEVANSWRRGLPLQVMAGDPNDALGRAVVGRRVGAEESLQLSAEDVSQLGLGKLVAGTGGTLRVTVLDPRL